MATKTRTINSSVVLSDGKSLTADTINATVELGFSSGTLAAAGTNQATATAISDQLTAVTAADGTKGVKLPTAEDGELRFVINTDASSALKVYPNTSGTINGGSANAAVSIGPGQMGVFVGTSTTAWYVSLASLMSANAFLGTLTLTGNIVSNAGTGVSFGNAITEKVSLYGVAPVVQRASADQAAVSASGAGAFDGADTVDKATVLAAVQALQTLVNEIRTVLVNLGAMKGAA